MATGQWKVGESIPGAFVWYDSFGAPITSFTVAPTSSYTRPNGVIGAVILTQRGATPYWDFSYSPTLTGLHAVEAICLDPLVAAPRAPVLAILVSANSLSDLAKVSDLPAPLNSAQTQAAVAAALLAFDVVKVGDLTENGSGLDATAVQAACAAALLAYSTAKTSDVPNSAAIQAATTAALTVYTAAKVADVTGAAGLTEASAQAASLAALDQYVSLHAVFPADVRRWMGSGPNGLVTGDVPIDSTTIQSFVVAALTTYQATRVSDIPAAGELDTAAVQAACDAALVAYATAKTSQLPSAPPTVAQIQAADAAALTAYGAAKTSELPAAPLNSSATQALVAAALTAYQTSQKSDIPAPALSYNQTLSALQSAMAALGYSPERAALIDHLDSDISSVAESITLDSASIQAAVLLALAAYATAKSSDLPPAPLDVAATQAAVQAVMNALGYNADRADKIDHLDQNISSIITGDVTVAINLEEVEAAMNRALGADDPLAAPVPGTYPVDTAGWTLGQMGIIRDKVLLITEETVNFVGVIQPMTGEFTLVRGDSYTVGSSRPLPEWSNADWAALDLLHATSLTFKLRSTATGVVFSKALTHLSATQFRLELTSAETATFSPGRGNLYEVEAVLASGDVVTLATGIVVVVKDIR